jgi:outer membrane murein-binding lipoprotein Lpp
MTLIGAALIGSFIMVGCKKDNNKQKELELSASEQALKEKELSLQEKEAATLKAAASDTTKVFKTLTMVFEDYSEGDYPHLLFKEVTTGEDYDFRFLADNNLAGAEILLEDKDASFGLKANPKFLKKTFIVKTQKKSVKDSDLNGKVFNSNEWVITDIKLK